MLPGHKCLQKAFHTWGWVQQFSVPWTAAGISNMVKTTQAVFNLWVWKHVQSKSCWLTLHAASMWEAVSCGRWLHGRPQTPAALLAPSQTHRTRSPKKI